MDEPGKDVVILGAGFSKAVHEVFPVLSELAERVLPLIEGKAAPSTQTLVDELRRTIDSSKEDGSEFRSVIDFEAWLSRIAVDQPHLSIAENYDRLALFAQAATAIRRILLHATTVAFSDGPPSFTWVCQLLRVLDVRRATVITMNYDTIIERLAPNALWPWKSFPPVLSTNGAHEMVAADLFDDLPPTLPSPTNTIRVYYLDREHEIPRPPPETLRLIKLHGSLDWFAARGDQSGATLTRWEPNARTDDHDHPPGREPFLVPPDANKSAYFDNPLIRELWAHARMALEQATRVTFVGYSLPATDTTFTGLLADTIGGGDIEISVVDLKPELVTTRLRMLGISPTSTHGRADAVEAWTAALVEEQARTTASCLRDLAAPRADEPIWDALVNVASPCSRGLHAFQHVTSGTLVGDTFMLDLWPVTEPTIPDPRPLAEFRPPAEARTVAVTIGDTQRPVIAYSIDKPQEQTQAAQLVLLPSVAPSGHHS